MDSVRSRSLNFCTLPVEVFGSSPNTTVFGTLKREDVLYKHPDVSEVAVVARPDEKWGETPCAFVTLRDGAEVSEEDIIDHCRDNMARFKAPRKVVFGPLPKTSTGKIRKFELRERASRYLPTKLLGRDQSAESPTIATRL